MDRTHKTRVIAVCGKGGVGKTAVSALITKILVDRGDHTILAIDADPAVGLAYSLGLDIKKSVDDIRNDLIARLKKGDREDKQAVIQGLDYEVFSAIEERRNLAFLAIGRPETEGCYCQVNQILRDIIASLAEEFDYVVIDGEAGIEQVNRRVMERVSHLLLVSDASAKALQVAQTIKAVSDTAIAYEDVGLIVNRIQNREEMKGLPAWATCHCLGWVPEDDVIRRFDIEGRSILGLTACEAMASVERCLEKMGIFV